MPKYRVRINNPVIGVPITWLDKYDPEQFEIIGCADANIVPDGWKGASEEFVKLYYEQGNTGCYTVGNRLAHYIDKNGNAKIPYKRVLIRWKPEAMPNIDEDGVITYGK